MVENVLNMYKQGFGVKTISEDMKTTQYLVSKILKENGVKKRNLAEANTISNMRRSMKVNDAYFKTFSANMCYILGFISADGNVSKKRNHIKITLKREDGYMLEWMRKEMSIERTVKQYEAKCASVKFLTSELCFSSEEMKKDLAALGITPNKTQAIDMSKKIQNEYKIDFFRGFFDGDGSIGRIKTYKGKSVQFRVRIGTASENILTTFNDMLYETYGIDKVKVVDYTNSKGVYSLEYGTLASIKIYNVMYKKNSVYLKRKKKTFDDLILDRQQYKNSI